MQRIITPFTLPRWVVAEPGCMDSAGRWALKYGTRAFIGTGKSSARRQGLLQRVEKSVRAAGLEVEVFEGIPAEPSLEVAEEAASLAREKKCDVFVSLGGGSVLDTVKLVALLQENTAPAEQYQLGKAQPGEPCKPIIAIPMTAGTGSEATKVSVMTNERLGVKKAVYSWDMVATVALLDAEATVGLPPDKTRETGLDALGQAIEGYLSTSSDPATASAAAHAVRLIRDALPVAFRDGENLQARHDMLIASMMGGIAIGAGVGLGHEMAMAVGSYKKISHGLLVGILTPWCLEPSLGWADEKIAELAWHFRCPHRDSTAEQAALLVEEIFRFNRELELPPSLGEVGVNREDIEPVLAASKLSTDIRTNPRPLDDELRAATLAKAIGG